MEKRLLVDISFRSPVADCLYAEYYVLPDSRVRLTPKLNGQV